MSFIDPFPQLFSGLEVRDILVGNLHRLPCFWVTPGARRTVMQSEAAKATNFNASTVGKSSGHGVQNQPDRQVNVLLGQIGVYG